MKRFLTILCALCISGASLFAQNEPEVNVEGGIKVDVAFLNFLTKAAPKAVSTHNPGVSLGGFAAVDFNDWIGLPPDSLSILRRRFSFTLEESHLQFL